MQTYFVIVSWHTAKRFHCSFEWHLTPQMTLSIKTCIRRTLQHSPSSSAKYRFHCSLIFLFCFAEYQLYQKTAGNLRGVAHTPCTLPLDPPLQGNSQLQIVILLLTKCTGTMKQFHIGILKHKGRKMIINNEILYFPTQTWEVYFSFFKFNFVSFILPVISSQLD